MSLFEDASLIVTPNGRKAGKLFSLKPFNGIGDLTVVRATTATEVNASGVIVDVASNVARFDYTNSSCPSILVEPQRTNLALRSQEFSNSIWTTNGNQITISENSTISPDGTNSADAILTTTENSNHYIQQRTGTATAGVTYTMSIYVKKLGYDYCRIQASNTVTAYATFRFSTKELILGGANVVANSGKVTEMPNGWFRIEISMIPPFGVTWRWWVIVYDDLGNETFIGDVSKGLYVWGFQLEAGSNATSYIPTVASAVTRNADVISKSGIADLINGESGTLFLNSASLANDGTTKYFSINNGTTNNEIVFQYTSTSNTVGIRYLNGGVAQCDASVLITNALDFNKFAFTWQLNKFELWCNGIKVISDTSGSVTTSFNQIDFRRSNGTIPFFSKVKSVALWKTKLTDQQCISLTTL